MSKSKTKSKSKAVSQANKSTASTETILAKVRTILCGIFMGMADVVPGVSGGTVALVLGIYQRLVTAISRVDRKFFLLLGQRQFKKAFAHLDIVFLLCLLFGIGIGFVLTLLTIAKFLENDSYRPYVLATFFGLVLGAAWIVAKMIGGQDAKAKINWLAVIIGFGIAGTICWLSPGDSEGDPALWYIFLSGMVAICAMILPGISGALVLLLLGCYSYMVEVIKAILHRESLATNLPIAIVFSVGCLVGLLTFSKILKRLLEQKPAATMSLLCGLMLGSLFKLWPFQKDLTPEVEEFKHKVFQSTLPSEFSWNILGLALTAIVATVAVVAIEKIASARNQESR